MFALIFEKNTTTSQHVVKWKFVSGTVDGRNPAPVGR